jgi:hypothetical protein
MDIAKNVTTYREVHWIAKALLARESLAASIRALMRVQWMNRVHPKRASFVLLMMRTLGMLVTVHQFWRVMQTKDVQKGITAHLGTNAAQVVTS